MKLKFMLLAIVSFTAFASDIGKFLSEEKISSIQTRDIPSYEKSIEKSLKQPVKLKVHWDSFKEVSRTGAEFLGSTLHSVTGETVTNKSPEFIKNMKDVKTIKFDHLSTKSEAVVFKGKDLGELVIQGDFNNFKWKDGKGFASQLQSIMK